MDGRTSRIEVGGNGNRNVITSKERDRRRLLLAQIVKGARQEHGAGSRLRHGGDALFVEIFDVIAGKRAITGGELGTPHIGELLGMKLDRQVQGRSCLENGLRLFEIESDGLAESVNGIGKPG